jgi:hypothetical protein
MRVGSNHIVAEGPVGLVSRVTVRDRAILQRKRGGRRLIDHFGAAGLEVVVAGEVPDQLEPGIVRNVFTSKLRSCRVAASWPHPHGGKGREALPPSFTA